MEGVELDGPTSLRLLSDHLSVIDVDSGSSYRIIGLPDDTDVWWAEQQGRHVIITSDCVGYPVRPAVFVLGDGDDRAELVATGVFVTPGLDATLWAKTYATSSSCRLGRIGLDGEIVDAVRPVSCDTNVIADSSVGLIASIGDDPAVLDRSDFSVIRRWQAPIRLHAIVGRRALLSNHGRFTLVDLDTGVEMSVAAPRADGQPGPGAVSSDGRYVAVEYRSPAQIMDLWLLDVASLQWIHAPSMPVHALISDRPPCGHPTADSLSSATSAPNSHETMSLSSGTPTTPTSRSATSATTHCTSSSERPFPRAHRCRSKRPRAEVEGCSVATLGVRRPPVRSCVEAAAGTA